MKGGGGGGGGGSLGRLAAPCNVGRFQKGGKKKHKIEGEKCHPSPRWIVFSLNVHVIAD